MAATSRFRIGDFGRVVTGKTPPTEKTELYGDRFPFITPTDIDTSRYCEPERRLSEEGADSMRKLELPTGTVCVTCIASVGKMCMTKEPSFTNQQINSIIVDRKRHEPAFVYYLLHTQIELLKAVAGGTATPIINKTIFSRLPALAPPLELQKKIAAILSGYDELIENNETRIGLLEQSAEEIYREWFVRFRFPGHEKAKFVKGLPGDWDIKRVKEIVIRKGFGRIYREAELMDDGQVVVIDQSRADWLGFYDGEPQHVASYDSPIILFGDHTCKMVFMTKPFSLAENVVPFTPELGISSYFLFHLVKDLARTTEYKRHWTDLTNRKVLVPNERLQARFEDAVKRSHEQAELLRQTIRRAEKTRNLLLPRLISGKLSVENLDIQFPPSMTEELNDAPEATAHA